MALWYCNPRRLINHKWVVQWRHSSNANFWKAHSWPVQSTAFFPSLNYQGIIEHNLGISNVYPDNSYPTCSSGMVFPLLHPSHTSVKSHPFLIQTPRSWLPTQYELSYHIYNMNIIYTIWIIKYYSYWLAKKHTSRDKARIHKNKLI